MKRIASVGALDASAINQAQEQGYLFRLDDKKGWNRYWFRLQENSLFCYKGEKVNKNYAIIT